MPSFVFVILKRHILAWNRVFASFDAFGVLGLAVGETKNPAKREALSKEGCLFPLTCIVVYNTLVLRCECVTNEGLSI